MLNARFIHWDLRRKTATSGANESTFAAPVTILGKRIQKNYNSFRPSTEKLAFNHIFYTNTALNTGDKICKVGEEVGQIMTTDFGNGKYGLS